MTEREAARSLRRYGARFARSFATSSYTTPGDLTPEDLLSNKYGHRIHFWDLRARRNVQTIDLGANHQMALEVRPAHDPVREYGFLGVVVDTTNLEGSIWTWWDCFRRPRK